MLNNGFLAAAIAALCWGSFMVPFEKSKSSNLIYYQLLIAIGIFFSGLLISVLLGYPLNFNIYGIISGVLWGLATLFSMVAISNLGLSRAVPLMSSLVVISTFLWGALVFNELPDGIVMGLLGVGVIVLGVIIVSSTGKTESQNIKKGLIAGTIAGFIYGSQLVPIKIGNVATRDFFFPVCLGVLLLSLVAFIFKRGKFEKKTIGFGLLSGIVWNIGNLASLISLSLIGLSKSGPLSQFATLVAVLWGLFYFKEIKERKQKIQVLIGAAVLLIGIVMLGLS